MSSTTPVQLPEQARRNAPPGHVEREMMRLLRAREVNGVPEWDLPHYLVPLHWDGRKMWPGPAHMIGLEVHPDAHTDLLVQLAGQDCEAQRGCSPTLYGYVLAAEAHAVKHDPSASSELEKRQMKRDRITRGFHRRPDAREACIVMAADIDGRLWQYRRFRDAPRRVERVAWDGPGTRSNARSDRLLRDQLRYPRGRHVAALTAICGAVGITLYGDPMPGPAPSEDAEVVELPRHNV